VVLARDALQSEELSGFGSRPSTWARTSDLGPDLVFWTAEKSVGLRRLLKKENGPCRSSTSPFVALVNRVVELPVAATCQPRTKENSTMAENTVKLHRVLRAPAERIYRAFLDPDAMVKWLPPHGFTGKVHNIKAEVGGTYKMSFTNLTTGNSHSFGGEFLELVPNERIRHTDKFDDPSLPGQMHTTVSLKKVSVGTELTIVQEGIPSAIPAEACYLGWQESLTLLTQLVEPEIEQ
jgi:uncharacterized protein YndB with AHSA1/START domain